MSTTNNRDNSSQLKGEYKVLFKNTFYTYLNSYGSYLFSLATSFIIARTISKELWGFLLLGISFIAIISNILFFFPPSLSFTLAHYIPRYQIQKEYYNLKVLIRDALSQRIFVTILFFSAGLIVFSFFSDLFTPILHEHVNLLFILAPLIIIQGLNQAYTGVNQGFNQFKIIFYLLLVRYTIYIGGLLITFFLINPISIEIITLIYILSEIIPFLLNSINVLMRYMKIHTTIEKVKFSSLKETFKKIFNFGFYVSISAWITNMWHQVEYQSIGLLEDPKWVTGYSISINYFSVARFSISSFTNPLMVSFSRLDSIKNHDQMKKLFNLVLYYTSFFFMLFAGIFYLAADFFLSFFYGLSYLEFATMTKLLVIASMFTIIIPQFNALIQGTNKVKLIPKIQVIKSLIQVPLLLIGLIFFGILGMVIGIMIFNILMIILIIYLCYRIFDLTLEIKKIILQFIMILSSIALVSILEFLILDDINSQILKWLNLFTIFEHLNIFSILTFFIIYFGLNYFLKVFTNNDLENLLVLFESKKKKNMLVTKLLKFFSVFLNHNRNEKKGVGVDI